AFNIITRRDREGGMHMQLSRHESARSGARRNILALLIIVLVFGGACAQTAPAPESPAYPDSDPLPSWNDGAAKEAIFKFVSESTDESGQNYVAPEDRIAVFDQDG